MANVCKIVKDKNPSLVKHICQKIRQKQPWGQEIDFDGINKAKRQGTRSEKSGKSGRSAKSGTSSLRSKTRLMK